MSAPAPCEHPYGARCYAPRGGAEILDGLARRVDARAFNPDFPTYFPRFVQNAIWRFCAQDELNICNGNRIDDRRPATIDTARHSRIVIGSRWRVDAQGSASARIDGSISIRIASDRSNGRTCQKKRPSSGSRAICASILADR